MSEDKPNGNQSWQQNLVTWVMAAVILGYIIALNVLAFVTVFSKNA
jgi:hypothetical protein